MASRRIDRSHGDDSGCSSSSKVRNVRRGGYKVRRNVKGETELHRAAINGDYNAVERLVTKGHPVNEQDFAGWTPLHEACNWGHLDIVRLLIENGANVDIKAMGYFTPLLDASGNGHFEVIDILLNAGASLAAVDDQGNTVLDLLDLHKANDKNWSNADEDDYKRITKIMEERMKKGGIPLHKKSTKQGLETSQDRRPSRRSNIRSRTGVDMYTSAISSVRRSAARKTGAIFDYDAFSANRRSRHGESSSSKPALVTEQEYEVSDDWMIDDLDGHYIQTKPRNTQKKSSGRVIRSPSLSLSDDISSNSQERATTVNVDDCFDPETSDISRVTCSNEREGDDDPVLIEERPGRRASPKQRRLRQSILAVASPRSPAESASFAVLDDVNTVQAVDYAPVVTDVSAQPVQASNSHSGKPDIVRINVIVEGQKFAVILDNRYRTIEWLADKVSSSYEAANGKHPVVRLYTADNAALDISDTVEFLFYQTEELIGKIERFAILPMEQSYRQVCHRLKQDDCDDICLLLRNTEQSTILDTRGVCLRAAGGSSIILKTLQSEYNITSLNLRGQRLTTADAVELGRTLICIKQLVDLVVSCTGMHCEQILALTAEMCRENDRRYALEKLDVSFNPIGDASASPLARILLRCPELRFLKMQCIGATARFVQDHRISLREALSNVPVACLDLSRNRLGDSAADLRSMLNSSARYVELKLY